MVCISYFIADYGLISLGAIEDKPGVPPSAQRILQVAKLASENNVHVVLTTSYNPKNILERFSALSNVSYITLPSMLNPSQGIKDFGVLQEMIADKIIASLKPKKLN